ncbi:MAG: glycosyltransferase family 4 protein [Woeseia sp.]
MRVLLVHNYYGSAAPSGENVVFEAELRLLKERGHDVALFTRHSDQIRSSNLFAAAAGAIYGGLVTPWNPLSVRALDRAMSDFQPNVVHIHNTFPLISPGVFGRAHRHAATVLTLHNYRLQCAAGIPMRNGKVCTQCIDRQASWPAVMHGCYRGSRAASVPVAAKIALHRRLGTWSNEIDAYIALSDFQRQRMTDGGLPARKMFVKPNFFPGSPDVIPWEEREERAVCVGRVGAEKGVTELVDAWLAWGAAAPELAIVGDGPLRQVLEQRVTRSGVKNIRFVGQVDAETAQRWVATSKLLLLPSKWFEGFPMALREAFAYGTPAIVSNLGPLPEIVADGMAGAIVEAGNSRNLMEVAATVWQDEPRLRDLSIAARREYETKYTEGVNYQSLMNIYKHAISIREHECTGEREVA